MRFTKLTVVAAIALCAVSGSTAAAEGRDHGAYRCTVSNVYREPDNSIAAAYEGGILLLDSKTGSLQASVHPLDLLNGGYDKSTRAPFALVRDDFRIATPPGPNSGLAAVAMREPFFSPTHQPSIAWFKLDPSGRTFKFFSTWIEAVVVGTCDRVR